MIEPAVCADARQTFAYFAQALTPAQAEAAAEPPRADALRSAYKEYTAAVRALEKQVGHLKDSTERGPESLKLVPNTLRANGELHQLKKARENLIKSPGGKAWRPL